MIKKILHLLILLNVVGYGCRNLCTEVKNLESEVKPVLLCDLLLDDFYPRCRCRCYNFYQATTVDMKLCDATIDGEVINLPIESCSGIAGFQLEAWAEIVPSMQKLNNLKNTLCKNK